MESAGPIGDMFLSFRKMCFSPLLRKVFSKLDFHVPEETLKKIVLSTSGAIVPVLNTLREKIDKKLEHSTENILVCAEAYYKSPLVSVNAGYLQDITVYFPP